MSLLLLFGVAGSGTPTISGSLDATLGGLTLSGTGTVIDQGVEGGTLGALTVSAAGAIIVSSTLAATLGALSGSGTGTVAVSGALDESLGVLTLGAQGFIGAISGALDKTLGNLTLSGTGTNGLASPLLRSPGALLTDTGPRVLRNFQSIAVGETDWRAFDFTNDVNGVVPTSVAWTCSFVSGPTTDADPQTHVIGSQILTSCTVLVGSLHTPVAKPTGQYAYVELSGFETPGSRYFLEAALTLPDGRVLKKSAYIDAVT